MILMLMFQGGIGLIINGFSHLAHVSHLAHSLCEGAHISCAYFAYLSEYVSTRIRYKGAFVVTPARKVSVKSRFGGIEGWSA